jgi:hypothetical protein
MDRISRILGVRADFIYSAMQFRKYMTHLDWFNADAEFLVLNCSRRTWREA